MRTNAESATELSSAQIERIEAVHDAVYDLCVTLTEDDDLEYDMEFIGEIADAACEILSDLGYRIRYPAVCHSDSGNDCVTDYYNEGQP